MSTGEIMQLRDDVKARLRLRVLEAIEVVLEEEVAEVLGASRHERSDVRRGYRNGSIKRKVDHGSRSRYDHDPTSSSHGKRWRDERVQE